MIAAGSFAATRTTGTVSVCDRLQHGPEVGHVGEAVLHVDDQRVEALPGHDLRGEAVGDGEPAHGHALALTPHLPDPVRPHRVTPLVIGVPWGRRVAAGWRAKRITARVV